MLRMMVYVVDMVIECSEWWVNVGKMNEKWWESGVVRGFKYKEKNVQALRLHGESPTPLLSQLYDTWLPSSDGIGYVRRDMAERDSIGKFRV